MKEADPRVVAEVESLEQDGVVTPDRVVEFAADPATALHKRFEWDNDVAGHEYRLHQARQIIHSIKVTFEGPSERVVKYTSLIADRRNGDSYRRTENILNNADYRRMLVRQALKDFTSARLRYKHLHELAELFEAVEKQEAKYAS